MNQETFDWLTVKEHGLPEPGQKVIAGFWYTDNWLRPEIARQFYSAICQTVKIDDLENFPEGLMWVGQSSGHNSITHWRRFSLPEDKE